MKWKKFQELVKRYPFVASDVGLLDVSLANNKQFVRRHVGFIAFRPFESLDLNSHSTFKVVPTETSPTTPPSYRFEMVEYSICVTFGDKTGRITLNTPNSPTIKEAIEKFDTFYETRVGVDEQSVDWKHVVRKSVRGNSDAHLVTEMNIEIYPFPRFYRARPIPMPSMTLPSPSHIAYMTGAHMPPLIPGTLRFSGDPG